MFVYRVTTGGWDQAQHMRHTFWQTRWSATVRAGVRATVRAGARRAGVIVVAGSGLLFAGCGLFGGDDESPQVVEPPASTAQSGQSAQSTETPAALQQQDSAPAEAVAVTTSPQNSDEQPAAAAQEAQEAQAVVGGSIYVVQSGDTLAEIAEQHGVRIDDLITLNGIQNPDVLQVGQQLQIPVTLEPGSATSQASAEQAEPPSGEQSDEQAQEEASEEEEIDVPAVSLPTVAVPAATPTTVSHTQFPQPGPEVTTETIPNPPSSFLQYGAAALPWLHGISEVEPIIDLFRAWPMPSLAVGNDRVVLVDTNEDGAFTLSIVYTDPSTFGAAVPHSNLVVYDPVPGNVSSYRIGYDHAQAYAREVQGIQQLSDLDVSGDGRRDLTFREITCDGTGCVSSFYVLSATADGYRTITGSSAQVADVSGMTIADRNGDGIVDIVVEGLATDETAPARYEFLFSAQGGELVELQRVAVSGGGDELEE